MEPQEKMDTQQFIIDHLQEIQRKAESSNFDNALASLKEVKAIDPKNIYLIAIEKQIAKLSDPALEAENRTAIIKSLPPMIDRAIGDVQRRATVPKMEDSQKLQKEAALEKLKSQYFQRADDYVEKKEYQRALEEIRRIYIIEPGSVVAKEYENKIEQLSALQARGESPTLPAEIVKESKKIAPVAQSIEAKSDVTKGSNKTKMLIIAAAVVVVISVGVWIILSNNAGNKSSDQASLQKPALSQENTAPTSSASTTSSPQPGKESSSMVESTKQLSKVQKTTPEIKPLTLDRIKNLLRHLRHHNRYERKHNRCSKYRRSPLLPRQQLNQLNNRRKLRKAHQLPCHLLPLNRSRNYYAASQQYIRKLQKKWDCKAE